MTEYGPGQGPGARQLTEDEILKILESQPFGTLATLKRSGQPHLATMVLNWNPEERIIRISSAEGRIKVKHLQNDPRATVQVQGENVFSYAVAEGEAEVSEASSTPGDAVGRELLAMAGGFEDPADETAFLEEMANGRRLVITLRVDRLYGTALDA